MPDIQLVKRNIARMIDQGAPETDIDAYLQSEKVDPRAFSATQRGAETESMAKPQPEIATVPQITKMTSGLVTRDLTAGVGGVVGAAAALPSMAALGPAGPAAGGVLGTIGGSYAFDFMEYMARQSMGLSIPKELTGTEPHKEALWQGAFEAAGAAGVPYIMPWFKRGLGWAAGVYGGGEQAIAARQITQMATRSKIVGKELVDDPLLGAAHVSERGFVKGAPTVLGVFPFVAVPYQKGQTAVVGKLDERAADLLNTLAPATSMTQASAGLVSGAQRRYDKFDRVSAALYGRFYDLADNLSVKDIVPTQPMKDYVGELAKMEAKSAIVLQGGEPMRKMGTDEVGDYLRQFASLPEHITVEQARMLERGLNEVYKRASLQGFDVSRLGGVKGALEVAKNSLDTTRLPPQEAQAVVKAWDTANNFFHETKKIFETSTARDFTAVDRNIFKKGMEKLGTKAKDEIFKAALNSNSPESLVDLRKLVGEVPFRNAVREHLDNAIQASIKQTPEGAIVPKMFSGADFEKRIGLNTTEGREALSEMLRGSAVSVSDLQRFVDVAKVATDISIKDPSKFIARRWVLTGLTAGAVAGSMVPGGATLSLPAGAVVTLAMRRGSRFLMDPNSLREMTGLLRPTADEAFKKAALSRIITRSLLPSENMHLMKEDQNAQGVR